MDKIKPNENKYGLKRSDLNSETKRIIREQCNFGCVICRGLPYTYEHFNPEFKDAKEHNPEGMALLCGNHQLDTSSPRLSKETIKSYKNDLNHLEKPAVWNVHHWGRLTLDIGSNLLSGIESKFIIQNETLISLKSFDGRLLLSGVIKNSSGDLCVEFIDNEILVKKGFWDFKLEGEVFELRNKPNDILIRLLFNFKENTIKIDRYKTHLGDDFSVDINHESIKIIDKKTKKVAASIKNNHLSGGVSKLNLSQQNDKWLLLM